MPLWQGSHTLKVDKTRSQVTRMRAHFGRKAGWGLPPIRPNKLTPVAPTHPHRQQNRGRGHLHRPTLASLCTLSWWGLSNNRSRAPHVESAQSILGPCSLHVVEVLGGGCPLSLVTAKQQTGNALHTHATEPGFEPGSRLACRGAVAFVRLGSKSNRPNGGCRLLPKRAKKYSIAADCGVLKATFGPRLRCAAEQQVKQ